MPDKLFDRAVFSDSSWWHWALTVPLLARSLGGETWAMPLAIALCIFMITYFRARIGAWRPLPVQVRVAYLALLVVGMLPLQQWLHWVQLCGTSSMVLFGYCPLARMLGLAPWNRTQPITRRLVWKAMVKDPCAGGLVRWSDSATAGACSCALPARQAISVCMSTATVETARDTALTECRRSAALVKSWRRPTTIERRGSTKAASL